MQVSAKPNWKIAIGIPAVIFLACFLMTLSSVFKSNEGLLSNAILADLLLTAPLIYLFAIRKSEFSLLTVSRVFIAGLFVGGLILNAHSNALLHFIKTFISPVIEGAVIFIVSRKFYIANKKAKAENDHIPDFLFHCRAVLKVAIGNEKAANIIASEIAVFYYAFFSKKYKADNKLSFTSYKENGIPIVLGVILSIFLIETVGMHFLLGIWNRTAAWMLTSLSIYTCIQLFAHINAIKARPIFINANSLQISNGLAADVSIEFRNVEKIESSNKIPPGCKPIKIALLQGLENHNIVLHLKQPVIITKMFGIKTSTDTVLFFVDKPGEFLLRMGLQHRS